MDDLKAFPGGDMIEQGLGDLAAGIRSPEALLVLIGAPRLRRLGLKIPDGATLDDGPEHELYRMLAEQSPEGAHSRYNALIRRLVSFERAAECAA